MKWISMQKQRVGRRFQAQTPPPPKTIKFEGWSCWIDEAKMMTNPADPLLYQIHKVPMKDFLSQLDHLRMTETGVNLGDWWSVKRALDSFLEMFHVWALKHMSQFCGVGQMQKMCGFWYHSKCPHC
jgi:hypothetical protein